MKKAKRILRYLAGAKDHGLYLGGDKIDCRIWVDTSRGVHGDGKGQGCIIISLGLGPVFVRSYKLRVTGLSSTEDEVVGVSDTTTYAPWMRALLEGFRQPQIKPTVIYQDNQSAMAMHVSGDSFIKTDFVIWLVLNVPTPYPTENHFDGQQLLIFETQK